VLIGGAPLVASANSIPITGPTTYQENFNSLINTGTGTWADNSTIVGWYAQRTGTGTSIVANNGSGTGGNLYSYGTGTDVDRALGSLGSGNAAAGSFAWGVAFQNTSGVPIAVTQIEYTGEQWRYSGTAAAQAVTLSFQTSGSPITALDPGSDSGWNALPAGDFSSPVISGTTGALDGNQSANRVPITLSTAITVQPNDYVVIRWRDIDHPSSDHGLAIDDVSITFGAPTADTTGPAPLALAPANGATGIPRNFLDLNINGTASVTFDEPIQLGSGSITLRRVDNDATVETIPVDFLNASVENGNQLVFFVLSLLNYETEYYFSIPAGAVKDNLNNTSLAFGAPASAKPWTFTTAAEPVVPTVVVNKYANLGGGASDLIELLVVGNGTAGTTLDMRGMIVKDFSSSMNSDGGGKYSFNADAFWQAVPVGTQIVLSGGNSSPDIDASDFKLSLGLADTTYFTSAGGSFDIATVDMVMVKAAGSDPAGVIGGIHALAAGNPGSFFTAFQGSKLITTTGDTGTNEGVIANNSNSEIQDFSGEDATADLPAASLLFGGPNNPANAVYLSELRGTILGDGDGVAVITNATPASPYVGKRIFGRSLSGQSAALTLQATLSPTISTVRIVVPAELGAPASVVLSGPAATLAGSTITGQTINITSAAVTTTDSLTVTIEGLSTPAPSLAGDYGSYPFAVSTATSAGVLTPIATNPAANVIIPISTLREVASNGVAAGLGKVVAIEGVVTAESLGSLNTEAFMQDDGAGIALFAPNTPTPFVRGKRYAVVGPVSQFNGLTQISFGSSDNVVDLGVATPPAPVILSVPAVLAAAETYEGSLVTLQNLTYVSGVWQNNSSVTLQDGNANTIVIRITLGSTAIPEPTYPVDVTGVFSQFDTSNPFTAGYQLQPRDTNDLLPGTPPPADNFAAWVSGFSGMGALTGFGDDADFDGLINGLEHVLGLAPNAANTSAPLVLQSATASSVTFRHTRIKTADLATDVLPVYQWSSDLGGWNPGGSVGGVTVSFGAASIVDGSNPDYDLVEVTATVTGGSASRLFVRYGAELQN
jgi:hypothetical protein